MLVGTESTFNLQLSLGGGGYLQGQRFHLSYCCLWRDTGKDRVVSGGILAGTEIPFNSVVSGEILEETVNPN